MASIVERYHDLAERCDAVVVVGSDYSEAASPIEFGVNGRIAAQPRGSRGRRRQRQRAPARRHRPPRRPHHQRTPPCPCDRTAVVVNRVDPASADSIRDRFDRRVTGGEHPLGCGSYPRIPWSQRPQIADALAAVDGTLIAGDDRLLDRVYLDTLICRDERRAPARLPRRRRSCASLPATVPMCWWPSPPAAPLRRSDGVGSRAHGRVRAGAQRVAARRRDRRPPPAHLHEARLVRHRSGDRGHRRAAVALLDPQDRPRPRHLRGPPRRRRRRDRATSRAPAWSPH